MKKTVSSTNRTKIDSVELMLKHKGKKRVANEYDINETTYHRSECKHSHPAKFQGPPSFKIVWEDAE
jgi:hypothetical protein